MTKPERRRIVQAIHHLDEGQEEIAREALCQLSGEQVPLPPERRLTPMAQLPGETVKAWRRRCTVLLDQHGEVVSAHPSILPQPKPTKRIVDLACLERYRAQHPWCELTACAGSAQVHHITKRGRGAKSKGGDDVQENLLSLCMEHHTGREGWHTLSAGPKAWFKKFNHRLPSEAFMKVAVGLGIMPA